MVSIVIKKSVIREYSSLRAENASRAAARKPHCGPSKKPRGAKKRQAKSKTGKNRQIVNVSLA